MTADLTVDMRNIGVELRLVSKTFAAAVRKEIRAAVEELGADHVDRVKSAAVSRGLHKAADAVYIRPNFSYRSSGVRIVVSRRLAPAASIYELGNRNDGQPEAGTFTNGTGGVIQKRPFFYETLRRLEPADEARILTAIDIICREAGFR